jgi:hypothetical protein
VGERRIAAKALQAAAADCQPEIYLIRAGERGADWGREKGLGERINCLGVDYPPYLESLLE